MGLFEVLAWDVFETRSWFFFDTSVWDFFEVSDLVFFILRLGFVETFDPSTGLNVVSSWGSLRLTQDLAEWGIVWPVLTPCYYVCIADV